MKRAAVLLLLAATLSAAAEVRVGPPIEAPRGPESAPTEATNGLLAAIDDTQLAVWRSNGQIFGQAFDADGKPLGPVQPIGTGIPLQLIAGGDRYYLLTDSTIHEIDRSGTPTGVRFASDLRITRIATNGSRLLAGYIQGTTLYGILLDRDLRVVRDAFRITPEDEGTNQYSFDLASAGGTFLAAWTESHGFAASAAIDADGNLQVAGIIFRAPGGSPLLGSSGTDYLLVLGSRTMHLSLRGLVSSDVVLLEPVYAVGYEVTSVTWNGHDYVVGLSDATGREGLCGSAAVAQVVGGERQILSDAKGGSQVQLAPRGDGYFAAWSVGGLSCSGVRYLAGRTVRSTPGELRALSSGNGGSPHVDPAIASDGTDALVVSLSGQLRLSHVATFGVDRAEELGAVSHPSVAFDGQRDLLVYATEDGVQGRYVSRSAGTGQPFTIAKAKDVGATAVARDGVAFDVVWSGPDSGGVQILTDGTIAALPIPSLAAAKGRIDIATGGAAPLVVWATQDGDVTTILGAYGGGAPFVIETVTSGLLPTQGSIAYAIEPRAACTREVCLVTWTQRGSQYRGSQGYGALVSPRGEVRFLRSGLGYTSAIGLPRPAPVVTPLGFRVFSRESDAIVERFVELDGRVGEEIEIANGLDETFEGDVAATLVNGTTIAVAYVRDRFGSLVVQYVVETGSRRRSR